MVRTRGPRVGPSARPVAIPDDVDDPTLPKAAGRIELPLWVRWSKRAPQLRPVRWIIDISELVRLWDDLVLSPHVGRAWEKWLRSRSYQ